MHGKIQAEQAPIDRAITEELISLLPEAWNSAVLEVRRGSDGESYEHEVTSPEKKRGVVMVSDLLFMKTRELALLFERYGAPFARIRYRVDRLKDGNWKFKADFEYV
jgi:hypothetical protein